MAEQVRKDVAVFIDFENIYVSVRDKLDTNPNFEIIMDRCNELGRVILARAYADWYRYPRITSALYANNIEPMYVPTYYYDKDAGRTGRPIKNSVDMNLCIEAMRTLFTMPGLSTFVLITGDRDFIPLVNSIRQQGKDVIIIGVGGAASSHLAQSADEFIFYEHLIGKQISTAPAAASNRRYSEIDEFERPARDRAAPVVQRAGRNDSAKADKADKAERKEKESTGLTEDAIWEMLAKAVIEARARSIVPSVGSLKTLIRELSNGEFRENMVRDANGRPLERFRDVVQEAANRGKLIISTDSIVNEIFLPGEDPRTLSSFNVPVEKPPERAEEPLPSTKSVANEARATQSNNEKSRNRRRNDRGNKRTQAATAPVASDVTVPVVDDYAIVPSEPVAVVVGAAAETTSPVEVPVQSNGVPFSDEERQMVRDIVAKSERALSFQQIYDALRATRNRGGDQQVPRTNEELRSLVKSIINAGELQRIGRGNRVSYRMITAKSTKVTLSSDGNDEHTHPDVANNDDTATDESMSITQESDAITDLSSAAVASVTETSTASALSTMIPTPDDTEDLDDGLSLPPLLPTKVIAPSEMSVDAVVSKGGVAPDTSTSRSGRSSAPAGKQTKPKKPVKQSKQSTTLDAVTEPTSALMPPKSVETSSKVGKSKGEAASSASRSTKPKATTKRTSPSKPVVSTPEVPTMPTSDVVPADTTKPRPRKKTAEN